MPKSIGSIVRIMDLMACYNDPRGELTCDNLETIGLKYFAINDLPEMFCKQHEDLKNDLIEKLVY